LLTIWLSVGAWLAADNRGRPPPPINPP
jgi:hypothetical protein